MEILPLFPLSGAQVNPEKTLLLLLPGKQDAVCVASVDSSMMSGCLMIVIEI